MRRSLLAFMLTVIVAGSFVGAAGLGETPRHRAPVEAFRRTHPCPATGQTTGACPGWVVDHKYPLCAGGADDPANMEWEGVEPAKAKDRLEVELCHCLARKGSR